MTGSWSEHETIEGRRRRIFPPVGGDEPQTGTFVLSPRALTRSTWPIVSGVIHEPPLNGRRGGDDTKVQWLASPEWF
jgi:hypothetical protein